MIGLGRAVKGLGQGTLTYVGQAKVEQNSLAVWPGLQFLGHYPKWRARAERKIILFFFLPSKNNFLMLEKSTGNKNWVLSCQNSSDVCLRSCPVGRYYGWILNFVGWYMMMKKKCCCFYMYTQCWKQWETAKLSFSAHIQHFLISFTSLH